MKITTEIDCTPQEARTFLGLPSVQPMQEKLMEEMQERMAARLRSMEPEELMRHWLPSNLKGLDSMMEAFLRMSGAKGK